MLFESIFFAAQILTTITYPELQTTVNIDPAQGGTYAIGTPLKAQAVVWGTTNIYGQQGTTTVVPTYGGGSVAYGPNGQTNTYVPSYGGGGTIYGSNGASAQVIPTYGGGRQVYGSDGSSATIVPTYGGGSNIYRSDGTSATVTPTYGGGVNVYENE